MTRNMATIAALLILSGTALAQESVEPTAGAAGAPVPAAGPDSSPPAVAPAVPPGERVAASAEPAAQPTADRDAEPAADSAPAVAGGPRSLAGMAILGNQEAPTSLVIVPWKSSEIGDGIGVSRALDPGIGPVDKDVFMRELRYYEIRTGAAE